MGMSVEGTSSIESSEIYGLYTGAIEESDREERSTKERDRYSSIFSETVHQPLNQAHQNKGRKPLMNRAPDLDMRAGYSDKEGKYAEIRITFRGEDSSDSDSSNKTDNRQEPNTYESSDQGGAPKNSGDSTERHDTKW